MSYALVLCSFFVLSGRGVIAYHLCICNACFKMATVSVEYWKLAHPWAKILQGGCVGNAFSLYVCC